MNHLPDRALPARAWQSPTSAPSSLRPHQGSGGALARLMDSGTYINPFISDAVPELWGALIEEFGRDAEYWPGNDPLQAVAIVLVWIEGVEDEEVSPGRYSHALIKNDELPVPPKQGDAVIKDGIEYDVVRVDAYAYECAQLVLQDRTEDY